MRCLIDFGNGDDVEIINIGPDKNSPERQFHIYAGSGPCIFLISTTVTEQLVGKHLFHLSTVTKTRANLVGFMLFHLKPLPEDGLTPGTFLFGGFKGGKFKIRSTSDKADAFLFALMLKVPESKKYFELEQWAQLKVKGNE